MAGPDVAPPRKKKAIVHKPSPGKKSSAGIHQSAVQAAPTKVLENELKRRSRTDKGPDKAPRWTPAGQLAHKSRGGKK